MPLIYADLMPIISLPLYYAAAFAMPLLSL